MVKNKRGWLRILEATISIMILAGVLITIYAMNKVPYNPSEEIYSIQESFLADVELNSDYRTKVLENNESALKNVARDYFPSYLNYSIRICNLKEIPEPCKLENQTYLSLIDKNIYVSQTIIATNLTEYSPKIIKIYSWEN